MTDRSDSSAGRPVIRTPDQRLRVFVSSTLQELAEERRTAHEAITHLRLAPVMFELGARPHPPRDLYRAYLEQSHIFIGIYWQKYGWIAPGETISGLEDEYQLCGSKPKLIYIKSPAPEREPRLKQLLDRIRDDDHASYKSFSSTAELCDLIENDLALLLTERFEQVKTDSDSPAKRRPSNVPIPRSSIVGRERELAAASSLLLREDVCLVTLTGPSGSGKSRLGLEVALDLLPRFEDGAFLVPLAPLTEPQLVPSAIANALDVRETIGGESLSEKLKDYLRSKHMLLLLDNFEHVVSAAPVIGEFLEASPGLKVLVTSRAPLHLRTEHELPVLPLNVPGRGLVPSAANLPQYAAVTLFEQRARSARPDFAVTDENAQAIAEVCRRLDGLPLALELAAARIRLLTPQALLARLEHRFDLLRGGSRDLPERQRTLRSAIDWSYTLLNDRVKTLFRRLSVFSGGWTLTGADVVCNASGDLGNDVMDDLELLVDDNLVTSSEGPDGEMRFGMLETIREFAREQLIESGEQKLLLWCHAGYMLKLAEDAEPHLISGARKPWVERLTMELDNLRSALAWSGSPQGDLETGLRIAGATAWYWFFSGYVTEGRSWVESLLARPIDEAERASLELSWAMASSASGGLAWAQGDTEVARARLEDSLAVYRRHDDKARLGQTMSFYGLFAMSRGEFAAARARLDQALELSRAAHHDWMIALTLNNLGDASAISGDLAEARSLYEQSLHGFRALGDSWGVALALNSLAGLTWIQEDYARAKELYAQSVELARDSGDRWTVVRPLLGLLESLWHLGDLEQAKSLACEALSRCRELGAMSGLLIALGSVAGLCVARGCPDIAVRLLGAGDALSGRLNYVSYAIDRMRIDRNLEATRAAMDEATFNAGWADGQALTPEQAVDYALREVTGL